MTVEAIQDKVGRVARHRPRPPADPMETLAQWFVTDEQVDNMKATRMIWRDIIALSHLSVWSAPGNGGKTSLAKFAAGELAEDDFKVLFFQEDASAGDLPALHEHAKEHGYRMLNSTLAGSAPEDQVKALREMSKRDTDLSGFVMFFDTLKKYTDLMSKGGARSFFQLMRSLTQRGATVILLGHTNKHRGVDGKLMFEGVGDVRNDVDEMIYIEATDKDPTGVVTLTMKPDKVRCAIKEATFTLDTKCMQVRALDHVVDVGALLEAKRRHEEDGPLIASISAVLRHGGKPRTDLVAAAVQQSGQSRTAVMRVLERYCTEDPEDQRALWLETRLKFNNTRHVAMRPGGAL